MIKQESPLVTIITVNFNGKQFLADCFYSLAALNYPKDKLEIIMVDNQSQDNSVQYVQDNFPAVKVIVNDTNNYAKANNLGIRDSNGEFIALINNDTKADPDWLKELINIVVKDGTIGAVGSKILFPDGSLESLGHKKCQNFYWQDIGFGEKDSDKQIITEDISSICGCSVLYRRKCLEDVGLLDEDFNIFMEDVDMGIRCRGKGWKLITCPESIIYHKFHGTIKSEEKARDWQEINRLLLIAKHWPEDLPKALYGKGYFTIYSKSNRDISDCLNRVFLKLSKEHGLEVTEKIMSKLSSVMHEIYASEKDYLVKELQDKSGALAKMNQQLVFKEQELAIIKERIVKAENKIVNTENRIKILQQNNFYLRSNLKNKLQELQGIYSSTGYRYFLKPLWNFLWPIKIMFKKEIKSPLCHWNKLLSMFRKNIFLKRNSWRKIYLSHLQKGTFPPSPETLTLMLTKRCNLHCKFCDIPGTNEEMKTEDAIRIINNAHAVGLAWLNISGGEPLLHSGLFDILAHAKNLGLKTSIATNGLLIKENLDKILRGQIDAISVSLDGTAQTHDQLRDKQGAYEVVKDNILELKKNNCNVSINFVLTNKNINDLEPIYDWAERERIPFDFWPVNHHKELNIDLQADYIKLAQFIKRLRRKRKISQSKYDYYLQVPFYLKNAGGLKLRCLALTKSFAVDVNGNITPCCVWSNKKNNLGNAIIDDIEVLWHSQEYRGVRNYIYRQGCKGDCYNVSLHEFTQITGENFIIID